MSLRILHTSDLHARTSFLLDAMRTTVWDVWVDTGDFFPNRTAGNRQIEPAFQTRWAEWPALGPKLVEILRGRPLLSVAGNHDYISLARVVQLAGRGVVLGDRTAGAVMRGRYHGLSTGAERVVMYGVNVTEADLVMSDGGRLEGVGVTPDEIILPGATEMAAGEDPVLAVALERLGVPMDAAGAGRLFPEP